MSIPKRVATRLSTNLKRFQGILGRAKSRDVNESDTVTIVADMLSELFGFKKYAEITTEYAIRGTYVDLAVKKDDKPIILIEVKPIGVDLSEKHIRQAVNYAASEGVEWLVLTNGIIWMIFRIAFVKPISAEKITQIDMLSLSYRKSSDIEHLYILTREGQRKSILEEYSERCEATNKFTLSAIIQEETIIKAIRREIKRAFPDVKVDLDVIYNTLLNEVLKREVVESDEAIDIKKKIERSIKRKLRSSVATSETKDQ